MVESLTIKNGVYLLMLLLTWIAACVVFGGELHIGKNDGNNTSFYQNHAVAGGTSVDYSNCSGSVCDKCKSGGGGAVAMAVFFFLTTMASIILRALAMAGKNTVVPSIGENEAKYASVEKILNYVTFGFLFLCVIIWGATCISEVNKQDNTSVQPTGYVYVVLCFIAMIVAMYLLSKIHDESGFGSGTGSKQQQQQQQQQQHAQAQASYPTPAEQQPPQDNATTQV